MLICESCCLESSGGTANMSYVRHSDVHTRSALSIMPASWEVVCRWESHRLFYHFWFLKHNHSAASPPPRCMRLLSYPWKLHACRANNNYFPYIFFYFLLYVFGIVFNCITYTGTIVTVYTDNIFYIIIYSKCIK